MSVQDLNTTTAKPMSYLFSPLTLALNALKVGGADALTAGANTLTGRSGGYAIPRRDWRALGELAGVMEGSGLQNERGVALRGSGPVDAMMRQAAMRRGAGEAYDEFSQDHPLAMGMVEGFSDPTALAGLGMAARGRGLLRLAQTSLAGRSETIGDRLARLALSGSDLPRSLPTGGISAVRKLTDPFTAGQTGTASKIANFAMLMPEARDYFTGNTLFDKAAGLVGRQLGDDLNFFGKGAYAAPKYTRDVQRPEWDVHDNNLERLSQLPGTRSVKRFGDAFVAEMQDGQKISGALSDEIQVTEAEIEAAGYSATGGATARGSFSPKEGYAFSKSAIRTTPNHEYTHYLIRSNKITPPELEGLKHDYDVYARRAQASGDGVQTFDDYVATSFEEHKRGQGTLGRLWDLGKQVATGRVSTRQVMGRIESGEAAVRLGSPLSGGTKDLSLADDVRRSEQRLRSLEEMAANAPQRDDTIMEMANRERSRLGSLTERQASESRKDFSLNRKDAKALVDSRLTYKAAKNNSRNWDPRTRLENMKDAATLFVRDMLHRYLAEDPQGANEMLKGLKPGLAHEYRDETRAGEWVNEAADVEESIDEPARKIDKVGLFDEAKGLLGTAETPDEIDKIVRGVASWGAKRGLTSWADDVLPSMSSGTTKRGRKLGRDVSEMRRSEALASDEGGLSLGIDERTGELTHFNVESWEPPKARGDKMLIRAAGDDVRTTKAEPGLFAKDETPEKILGLGRKPYRDPLSIQGAIKDDTRSSLGLGASTPTAMAQRMRRMALKGELDLEKFSEADLRRAASGVAELVGKPTSRRMIAGDLNSAKKVSHYPLSPSTDVLTSHDYPAQISWEKEPLHNWAITAPIEAVKARLKAVMERPEGLRPPEAQEPKASVPGGSQRQPVLGKVKAAPAEPLERADTHRLKIDKIHVREEGPALVREGLYNMDTPVASEDLVTPRRLGRGTPGGNVAGRQFASLQEAEEEARLAQKAFSISAFKPLGDYKSGIMHDIKETVRAAVRNPNQVYDRIRFLMTDTSVYINERLSRMIGQDVRNIDELVKSGQWSTAQAEAYRAIRTLSSERAVADGAIDAGLRDFNDRDLVWLADGTRKLKSKLTKSDQIIDMEWLLTPLGKDATIQDLDDIKTMALYEQMRTDSLGRRLLDYHKDKIPEVEKAAAQIMADPRRMHLASEGVRRMKTVADITLQTAVDAGLISADTAAMWKQRHPGYFAGLQRDLESAGVPMGELDVHGAPQPYHTLKGSDEKIHDPYVNLLNNYRNVYVAGRRNEVRRKLFDALAGDPDLRRRNVVRRYTHVTDPQTGEIKATLGDHNPDVTGQSPVEVADGYEVKRGGETWFYDVGDANLRASIDAIGKGSADWPVLRWPAQMTRWVVTNSPAFAIRNVIRDFQHRLVVSPVTGGEGVGAAFRNTKMAMTGKIDEAAWDLYGGSQSGFYATEKADYAQKMRRALKQHAGLVITPDGLSKWTEKAKDMVDSYSEFISKSEKWGRLSEFQTALDRFSKAGVPAEAARKLAAFASRDILDYSVHGEWVGKVSQLIPFFNAGIQGSGRMMRELLAGNWKGVAKRWAAFVVGPEVAVYALNKAYGSDEEWHELPSYQKDLFYNIKVPGVSNMWLRIPKPYELGAMSALVSRSLDGAFGSHGKGFWKGAGLGEGAESALGSVFPIGESALSGPFKPLIELITNYDFFRKKHIVSPFEERLDVRLRDGTKTASRGGRAIQDFLGLAGIGVDARNIDHLAQSFGGDFSRAMMMASDIGTKRISTARALNMGLGVFSETPGAASESVNKAMLGAQRADQLRSTDMRAFQKQRQGLFSAKGDADYEAKAKAVRRLGRALQARYEAPGVMNAALAKQREEALRE